MYYALIKIEKGLRLFVPRDRYQYIPHELFNVADGFITENVRDSVCGFITSDQGFAFFHATLDSNVTFIAKQVFDDFASASSIKMTLFGGNPYYDSYFPWESKNRNILYSIHKPRDRCRGLDTEIEPSTPNIIKGEYALQEIKNDVEKKPDYGFQDFSLLRNFFPLTYDIEKCIKSTEDNIVVFDVEQLNALLSPANKKLIAGGLRAQFNLYDIKDSIGYQNIARILFAFTQNKSLFNKNNIIHFNTVDCAQVVADFKEGQCKVLNSKTHLSYNKITVHQRQIKQIPPAGKIQPLLSLDELGIKSGYSMVKKQVKASRIFVQKSFYHYVPKSQFKSIDGFATRNLNEEVCGLITSDQGFAFFLFVHENNADCLAEYAAKDFADATNIKITLYGGNPGMLYFPWKSHKRNIMYSKFKSGSSTEVNPNASDLKNDEATLQLNQNQFFCFRNDLHASTPSEKAFASCIHSNDNNVLTYSIEKLNALLNPKERFIVISSNAQFTVYNVKDMIGYATYSSVKRLSPSF